MNENKNIPQQDITAVLADVAGAMAGQFEMPVLLNRIIKTTMGALNAEVCSIFLEDKEEEPGILKCVAGSGFAERIVGKAKYKFGEGFTGTVAKVGREFNIKSRKELENLELDGIKVWRGKHDSKQWESKESEFRNCIALPLKIKNQILGVIKVENKARGLGDFFTDEDLILFKTIANVIALTIENARLHKKAEAQSKTLATVLSDVAGAIVGKFDMTALLNQIVNTTMATLHAEVCLVFLEDKEKEPGIIKCVAGSGFAKRIVGIAEYQIGEGLTGSVAKFGEGYNSRSREEHESIMFGGKKIWKGKYDREQWMSEKNEFRNGIGLPLKIKDQILGVIKAENKDPQYGDFFTDDDVNIFKTIANVIALTIENARLHQKAEEQSKKLSAVLGDVAGAVVGKVDMAALLDQIINTTMKTLHAEVCSIYLENKEEEPGILKCVAGSGFAKGIVGVAKYKIGEGFTGAVAKIGKEFNIKSRDELKNLKVDGKRVWQGKFDSIQWRSGESEFRNCINLPLKIKDQILGVIKVENKEEKFGESFTEEDLNIFKTIANVIALTIENTRLHKKAEAQSKTLATVLADVAGEIVGQFDMAVLLNQIVNKTMATLHAEVCSIYLEDKEEEPGILKCVAGSGFAKGIVGVAKYKIGEGFTGAVAKIGKEFNIKSLDELKNLEVDGKRVWQGKFDNIQWRSGESEFRNCINLPLKIKDQILGVIKVENKEEKFGESFTDEDLNIFKTIANVIALTIENARLYKQIENQLKTIAAKTAHRINNQVTSYDGIELDLMDEVDAEIPNKDNLLSLSKKLKETNINIKNMIEDFRKYGKPIVLDKKVNEINKVIIDEIRLAKPPDDIKIKTDLDRTIPRFKFDAGRLAESIKEMLSNGLRVMMNQKTGNQITISTRLVNLKVDTPGSSEKVVLITIKDNGPGFPPNFVVFSPYQTTDPKRTGLGLATVKETIEAHGGAIELKTGKGRGTHFEIQIPIEGGDL